MCPVHALNFIIYLLTQTFRNRFLKYRVDCNLPGRPVPAYARTPCGAASQSADYDYDMAMMIIITIIITIIVIIIISSSSSSIVVFASLCLVRPLGLNTFITSKSLTAIFVERLQGIAKSETPQATVTI